MAKESFEDAEVATILNETFVSIKVDREERPDIDSIYMKVCQMMTGQGGWPLLFYSAKQLGAKVHTHTEVVQIIQDEKRQFIIQTTVGKYTAIRLLI